MGLRPYDSAMKIPTTRGKSLNKSAIDAQRISTWTVDVDLRPPFPGPLVKVPAGSTFAKAFAMSGLVHRGRAVQGNKPAV